MPSFVLCRVSSMSLFSVLSCTISILIQVSLSLQNQVIYNANQYTSHYESYHYHFDFLNVIENKTQNDKEILLGNLKINIHSLLNIEINNKYHLNYFNDSNWNEIVTINHQNSTEFPQHDMHRRRLLRTQHRYHLSPVSMSWYEGKAYCLQHYGSVASIMSKAENKLARRICPWHCWIGLKEGTVGDDDLMKSYRGCQDKTKTGKTCQKWTSQSPHRHSRTNENYPNTGVGTTTDDHNYCRNPDNEPLGIWCYTTDPKSRWEYCDPLDKDCDGGIAEGSMSYTRWNNGRIVSFSRWAPGEPNNDAHMGADCGEIYANWRGYWNDLPCKRRRFVLCEEGRGQLFGNFIAVQAPKSWQDAEDFCQEHYGMVFLCNIV